MNKIYFFQKRDILDGTLMKEIIDCNERDAWNHFKSPRFFKYLGWSDGRFIKNVDIARQKKRADGISEQASEKDRDTLLSAYDQEVEFARNNPDKTPPRDLTKLNLNGQVQDNAQILGALKSLK